MARIIMIQAEPGAELHRDALRRTDEVLGDSRLTGRVDSVATAVWFTELDVADVRRYVLPTWSTFPGTTITYARPTPGEWVAIEPEVER